MANFLQRLFHQTKEEAVFCAAVVVAAGASTRMEGLDKILTPLAGEPILAHTLRALENNSSIGEIVVVTREDMLLPVSGLCKENNFTKVTKIVVGGDSRAKSVRLGTLEVSDAAALIAVHDGARPLVTEAVISAVIARAAECAAAAPAVPVKDTIKRAVGGLVTDTLNRTELFAVQTPQVFESSLLKAALEKAIADGAEITDDCSAVERLGMTVALTEGDDTNLKITTPADLAAAEGILAWRAEQ